MTSPDANGWMPISSEPESARLLAVVDGAFACTWHFATLLPDGRWIDLSHGVEFRPTHWQPLPEPPAGKAA